MQQGQQQEQQQWSFAQRRPGWQLPSLNVEDLQLDSFEPQDQAPRRQPCPQCGKSRSLFCYDCLVPFTSTPSVKLPFQLHIITHSAEPPAKATGVHAAVLCRGQVHLQSLEALPQLDPARCAVMFPSEDALLPDQLPVEQLEHVIIIDAKWRKAKELNGSPAFDGMKRVRLPGQPRSSFWRFHTEGVSEEGVCTIEALHLLMRALAVHYPEPAGYWDNLLWYYAYQHQIVERAAADKANKRLACEQQGGYKKQKRRRQQQEQQQADQQQQQPQQQEQQQQQQQQQQQRQEQQQEQSQPQQGQGSSAADVIHDKGATEQQGVLAVESLQEQPC